MKLAERMSRLGTESAFEVLAQAKALEAQGKKIVHMEIGEPDFDTPAHIGEAAYRAIQDGYTHYGPSAGLREHNQAVADYFNNHYGLDYGVENVVVAPGAKPFLFFAILALAGEGEEVIYPNPGFPVYESVAEFAGAKAVPLPLLEENDFAFTLEDVASRVTPKTRLLILNYPHNPTGGILSRELLEGIARLAIDRDFVVLADEVYSRMVYDGEHYSIAQVPGMKERTILLDGYSKTFAMTGWRLGFIAAPVELADAITRLITNSVSCTASFEQMAGIAALTGPQDEVHRMVEEFHRRRDFIVKGLNEIKGVSCKNPGGAFYVFPNVREVPMTPEELAPYLMREAGVACLPGTSFGEYGKGHLRFSYAVSHEEIEEALTNMDKAINNI
ncbi:MAG: pyridoxal phosphate-dependent aminotransferase [Nitrospinota bacterium]|jgi:aspartate/methionine/tyrosine aminotransferase|nr:pyridoxal phosphate-dependent aminotransferase [Nitrospinota bacterium]MDP6482819.1 pyridoxal phosphate-dependent aminotransferase [Nitrospinota bacterium]